MIQICNKISETLAERGWSQAKLAKKSDLKQASISRYVAGKTEPKVSDALKIAKALDVSLEYLISGVDAHWENSVAVEILSQNDSKMNNESNLTRMIPVIGWAHAGNPMNYEENPWEQHIPTECRDPDAFAVVLEGDSMEPRFEERDMLIVQPSEEAYSGSLAVAKFSDGGVIFRRIEFELDTVRLIPSNVRYQITAHSRGDFEWIYPIWGRWTQIWK